MDRRAFVGTLASTLLAAPVAAVAQPAAKIARIGYLAPNMAGSPHPHETALPLSAVIGVIGLAVFLALLGFTVYLIFQ